MSDERTATWFFDRMRHEDEFTVTEEHVALLRRANIEWHHHEWGAAAGLSTKRPYGNSDRHTDIAEIVDGAFLNALGDGARRDYIEANAERWERLHAEIGIALQIFLHTQQVRAGRYRRERSSGWTQIA